MPAGRVHKFDHFSRGSCIIPDMTRVQEGEEQVLKLVRDDPGLLWITLAACETALQRIDVA